MASRGLQALRQLLCMELKAQGSYVREIQATPFASWLPCYGFYRNWTPIFVDIKDLREIYVSSFRISSMAVGGPNNSWEFTKPGSLCQESLDETVLYVPCKHSSHLWIHQVKSGFLGFLNLWGPWFSERLQKQAKKSFFSILWYTFDA